MVETQTGRHSEITAEELLSLAAELAGHISGNDAHSAAISAIVSEYLNLGNVDRAAELADTIEDPFARDRLLVATAEKCAEIDDDEYALQLADAIEEESLRQQALTLIGRQKVAKGQIEKARSVITQMLHPDAVLAALVVRESRDGNFDAARSIAGEIDDIAAAVYALIEGSEQLTNARNIDSAVSLLEFAVEISKQIEHPEEKVRVMIDVANALVSAGRSDLAIERFEDARLAASEIDSIHRDSLLAAVAVGFMRAGSETLAEHTLDLVVDKTQLAGALKVMADEYRRSNRESDAVEALSEAFEILRSERDDERRDTRASNATFAAIALGFAENGNLERAIEVADSIGDEQVKTSALIEIAKVRAEAGEYEDVTQIIKLLSDETDRLFALIDASDVIAKNDPETAIGYLREAATLVDAPERIAVRLNANLGIARRFAGFGLKDEAGDLLSDTITLLGDVRDVSIRASVLAQLSGLIGKDFFSPSVSDREGIEKIVHESRLL